MGATILKAAMLIYVMFIILATVLYIYYDTVIGHVFTDCIPVLFTMHHNGGYCDNKYPAYDEVYYESIIQTAICLC